MTKNDPNKITATMKLVVTGEFYDDEASEETLRYCVEQDLEDAGFEVDVSILKEWEGYVSIPFSWLVKFCTHIDFKEPVSDQERELLWREKLNQKFGIGV